MKPIFKRALEVTLKKISIIIVILVGIECARLMIQNFNLSGSAAFEALLENMSSFQNVLVFLGMNGIVLSIITVSVGSGLISTEAHEGTLKLLSAKPNSRAQILISKLFGAYLGLAILMILQLLAYYGYIVTMSNFDGNLINELVGYLPGYIAYGFIIITIMLAASTLLGTIAKKKVAALLPLLAIVIIIFGAIPFYRIFADLLGSKVGPLSEYIDLNYHFATIFRYCISYKGVLANSELMAYLTNLCTLLPLDWDVVRETGGARVLLENNSLSALAVLVAYGAVAAVMYIGSFAVLKKKDI